MNLNRLEVTPFPLLIGEIITEQKSGVLTVFREPVRKVLYWVTGELVLVTSNSIHESLGAFLFKRNLVGREEALQLTPQDWTDTVPLFLEGELAQEIAQKEALLRDWLLAVCSPLFSFTDGTAVFTDGTILDQRKQVFIRSTPAFVIDGIRTITNGLVLRRSLGDLTRKIVTASSPLFDLATLPLTNAERQIAAQLREPESIEDFARRIPAESAAMARVLIMMMTLGIFPIYDGTPEPRKTVDTYDPQRDLLLMAAIGSGDERSLRAVAFARQLPSMTLYDILKMPGATTQMEIIKRISEMKKLFDPSTYPPVVKDEVEMIRKRIIDAETTLADPLKRQEYDALLKKTRSGDHQYSVEQTLTRRAMAEKNFRRASQLSAKGDFYGAIVLLKQTVDFAPDHADAWFLLASCQERNPQWHREATDSFQRALAINPNHVEALISLGDLYRDQGLISRAESCYEDVLLIDEENPQALKRLKRKPKKKEE
ncbi:MAG: tetratricopeptide repeat protein [Acidobacteriota bacterium]